MKLYQGLIVENGIKSTRQAKRIMVSLSRPSKMPSYGYSIPAKRCITGSKLRQVEGSTCSGCYAFDGFYKTNHVQDVLEKRYKAIFKEKWTDSMVFMIKKLQIRWFRWHDSGDLQGIWHLEKMIEIAERTPKTRYWLPTREWGMIRKYVEDLGRKFPKNFKVILSATMFDQGPLTELANKLGVAASGAASTGVTCPAHKQGNSCGDCRKCWDKRVKSVVYYKHDDPYAHKHLQNLTPAKMERIKKLYKKGIGFKKLSKMFKLSPKRLGYVVMGLGKTDMRAFNKGRPYP